MTRLTLDETIRQVLLEAGRGLTVAEIACIIRERKLYLRRDGNPPERSQVSVRIHGRPALFEIDRSTYPSTIWLTAEGRPGQTPRAVVTHAGTGSDSGGSNEVTDEWWWEGKVQARVVAWLGEKGWLVASAANTRTRARGADIVATSGGRTLIVEVKGYPSTRYRAGPNEGQAKKTNPRLQARHWFAEALLSAILHKESNARSEVALAFPDVERYRDLINRTERALRNLGLGVYLVPEVGGLIQRIPP